MNLIFFLQIKAEKYLTQEEKEQLELLAKLEMERRLAATVIKTVSFLQAFVSGQAYLINAALEQASNVVWENKFKLVGNDMCLFPLIIAYNQNYMAQLGGEKVVLDSQFSNMCLGTI